ncbi:hypothetical protein MNB_SV-3-956 [hydrothermal vent metagenome]|uniref:GH18 domain-containing protein n=1 Tax=hydrothermal vent metagenome TaxID=652676 RepID=A0A1W1BGD1_9ZZZZ
MYGVIKVLVTGMILAGLNSCGGGSSYRETNSSINYLKRLSFYAWDGISKYETALTRLEGYQKIEIYLNPVEDGNTDNFTANVEKIQKKGSDVWYLMSAEPTIDYIEDQTQIIVEYNQNHEQKIVGMAFDIEPWTKFEDQNSSENRDEWQNYLDLLSDASEVLHKNKLKISVSIPFWLNTITEAFPNGRNLNYEVVDIADEVIVMDYTILQERFYPFAENTLTYADTKASKTVKIALEMVDTNESNVSFYNDPEKIKPFLATPIPNHSFRGYTLHTLSAFKDSGIALEAP